MHHTCSTLDRAPYIVSSIQSYIRSHSLNIVYIVSSYPESIALLPHSLYPSHVQNPFTPPDWNGPSAIRTFVAIHSSSLPGSHYQHLPTIAGRRVSQVVLLGGCELMAEYVDVAGVKLVLILPVSIPHHDAAGC